MAAFIREDGISISITEAAPSHFMFKIQSVSLLTSNNIEKYTSAFFEAGGYKWKLIFYPNGNKRKNVTDHFSMYLTVAETSNLLPGWEVHAVFRLFLLDQNNDTYLVIRDAQEKGKRFRATKMEWGYERVIPLTTFKDASYGYVVDDECVFGAEVYVLKELRFLKGLPRFPKGECFSMIKDPVCYKDSWKIENFFTSNEQFQESKIFQRWKMLIYPNGKDTGAGTHLSLYLTLAKPKDLTPPSQIYAEFTLRLLDQHNHKNWTVKGTHWFSRTRTIYEWPRFISVGYFKTPAAGFLSRDTCTIEAEVRVHGETQALQ